MSLCDQQVFLNVVELDAPGGGGTTAVQSWQEHACPSMRQRAYIFDKLLQSKLMMKVGVLGTADATYQ